MPKSLSELFTPPSSAEDRRVLYSQIALYVFVPCIATQLCYVNQQYVFFKLIF
jgi:hypothetical protein